MRTILRLRRALLLLSLTLPLAARGAGDYSIVPGEMGPNALPTIPNADPVVGRDLRIELTAAAQLSDDASDRSFTPYFHLTVPFHEVASIEFDGTPLELWRISDATRERFGATRSSGLSPGDIRFGARFLILREGERLPAFGIRFITKTTTGKDFEDRRFINAPAYILDLLLGKTLLTGDGPLRRLRLLARGGFTAWQQGAQWQDDAPTYGATLLATWAHDLRTELELRGYWGYEGNDRPLLLSAGLHKTDRPHHVEYGLTLNRGLTDDAPAWEIRAGIAVLFEVPYLLD
jgi:hypothetical protein